MMTRTSRATLSACTRSMARSLPSGVALKSTTPTTKTRCCWVSSANPTTALHVQRSIICWAPELQAQYFYHLLIAVCMIVLAWQELRTPSARPFPLCLAPPRPRISMIRVLPRQLISFGNMD